MSRGLWRQQNWVQHTHTSSHSLQHQDTYHLQNSFSRCLPDEATRSGPVLGEGQKRAFKTSRWVKAGTSREAHSMVATGQGPSVHMVVNKRPFPPLPQQLSCKLLHGYNVSCILLELATCAVHSLNNCTWQPGVESFLY